MRINHNIAALNTYRQLNSASGAQAKSMEKLSSGLRINKAGDDAAGLAISEKMRGQIRGLDMASRNAQDGISMIQTAEGALNETHSILQRMRELATQAANDTNTDTDRGEIQKEINQLTSEVNRIGNTTEFNTQKLLNGGPGKTTEVSVTVGKEGAAVGTVTGEIGGLSTSNSTAVQGYEAGQPATFNTGTFTPLTDGQTGTITFNGVTLTITGDDAGTEGNTLVTANSATLTIDTDSTTSATDQMTLIKAAFTAIKGAGDASGPLADFTIGGTDNLTFTADTNNTTSNTLTIGNTGNVTIVNSGAATRTQDGEAPTQATSTFTIDTNLGEGDVVTVGGKEYKAVTGEAGAGEFQIGDDEDATAAALAAAITADSDPTTGSKYTAVAGTDGTGTITLTQRTASASNATAAVSIANPADKQEVGFDISALKAGDSIKIGETTITVTDDAEADAAAITAGTKMLVGTNADDQASKLVAAINANTNLEGTYDATVSGNTVKLTSDVAGVATAPTVSTTQAAGNGFSASFQIGANAGQSMTIDVRDMRADSDALQIASSDKTEVLSKSGKVAKFTEEPVVTNGTNNAATFKALDVSSHENASAAIDVLNDAIESVSAERSKLGAFQNRLEHTINNLGTSSENLTAAESRVRDVDMAKEMMDQTKNSILSQAAQAMLAQANQQPQGVLQLLR